MIMYDNLKRGAAFFFENKNIMVYFLCEVPNAPELGVFATVDKVNSELIDNAIILDEIDITRVESKDKDWV